MSGIRVTYSGLISFVIGIGSIVTGMIFTLIVTRRLTPDEFGEWGLIGALTGYVLIMIPVISYWSPREIARGEKSGKTAFQSSILFSFGAILVYLIIAKLIGLQTELDLELLFLASIIIPVEFARKSLTNICLGFKPQGGEYGILVFEFTKIPVGLILIYFLDMGLAGAIITSALSSLASVIVLMIVARQQIKEKFDPRYIKKWLRLSWLPLYPKISTLVSNSDITIFTILTGSVTGLAYWGVANAVARLVRHSSKINKALYPKLLSGGKKEYLEENITHVFYFAFPLAAISITFSRPTLFTLNPLYEVAVLVVLVLVPVIFLRTFTAIFTQALQGIERVDINEKATFKDYLKSKLFFLPTLGNIQRSIYFVSLVILLIIMIPRTESELDLIVYWAIISFITQLPFTIYHYFLVKREFHPKFNYKVIIKYLLVTIVVFSIIYFIMDEFLIYKKEIAYFAPRFLVFVVAAIVGYLGITYVIDPQIRKLFTAVINELKNLMRQKKSVK